MNHQNLSKKDKKYLWRPFTQQQEWERDQDITIITKGKGTYLYDAKGQKYLDGVSSLWCNVHGTRFLKSIKHSKESKPFGVVLRGDDDLVFPGFAADAGKNDEGVAAFPPLLKFLGFRDHSL